MYCKKKAEEKEKENMDFDKVDFKKGINEYE
jgi:hypothetical protein